MTRNNVRDLERFAVMTYNLFYLQMLAKLDPEQIKKCIRITTQLEDVLRNQQLRTLEQEIQSRQESRSGDC